MSFISQNTLLSLPQMQENVMIGNVAERIKLNPRRAKQVSQNTAAAPVPTNTVPESVQTTIDTPILTDTPAPTPPTPFRTTAEANKLVLALNKYLASPNIKFGSSQLAVAQNTVGKKLLKEETPACDIQKSIEEDLPEENHQNLLEIETETQEAALILTALKSSSRKRSADTSLSPFKSPKSVKFAKDTKKAIKTPTKSKRKSPLKTAIKQGSVFPEMKPVQPLVLYKIPQTKDQPSKYHIEQEYLLTKDEVLLLRPSTDRQALAATFKAPYKLHPFCRPFLLTKREHTLWWKMVLEKKAGFQKENTNTIKVELAEA